MPRNPTRKREQDPRVKLFPANRKWVDVNAYTFANVILECQEQGKLDDLLEVLRNDHFTMKAATVNASKSILRDAEADLASPFARVYLRLDPGLCKKRPYCPPIRRGHFAIADSGLDSASFDA